jgi:hypothetical protein
MQHNLRFLLTRLPVNPQVSQGVLSPPTTFTSWARTQVSQGGLARRCPKVGSHAGVPRWARTQVSQACDYSRKQNLRSPEKTPLVSVQLKEAEHSRPKARFA